MWPCEVLVYNGIWWFWNNKNGKKKTALSSYQFELVAHCGGGTNMANGFSVSFKFWNIAIARALIIERILFNIYIPDVSPCNCVPGCIREKCRKGQGKIESAINKLSPKDFPSRKWEKLIRLRHRRAIGLSAPWENTGTLQYFLNSFALFDRYHNKNALHFEQCAHVLCEREH